MAAAKAKINPELDKAMTKLLRQVMSAEANCSLTDKMKVIDRVIKVEGLKLKVDDAGFGSGFGDEDEADE